MAQEQRPTPSFTLIIDSDTNELIPEEELQKRRAWTEEARRSNLVLSYTDPITDTKVTQDEWIRREQVRVRYDINPRHCVDEEAIAELKASLSRQEWLKASPKRRSTAGTLDPAVGVAVGLPGSVGPQLNTLAVKSNVGKGKWNLAYSPLVPERLSEETSPFYSCTAFIVRHRRVSTSELFTAYQQFTDLAQQLSQITGDVTVDLSVLSALVGQVIAEFNVVSSQSINIREEADLAKEGFLSALVDRYGWDRDIGEFVNIDISSLSEDITQTLIRAREIFEDNLDDNNELSYGDNGEMFYSKSGKQTESLILFDDSIDSPSLVSAVMDADMERAIIASLKDMAVQDGEDRLGESSSSPTSSTSTYGRRSDTTLSTSSYDMLDGEELEDDYAIFGVGLLSEAWLSEEEDN